MSEGDIDLIALPQADGRPKNRPVLLLRRLPPFGDWLACGIGSQLQQKGPDFDDLILRTDADFVASGLVTESLVRLGFLAVIPTRNLLGSIGRIDDARHRRILERLSQHLRP